MSRRQVIPDEILKFANDEELKTIKLYRQHGTKKTAEILGLTKQGVQYRIKTVRDKAALQGISPEHKFTNEVPDIFYAKGVTTQTDKDGNVTQTWTKAYVKQDEKLRLLRQAIQDSIDDFKGAMPKIPYKRKGTYKDIMALYPMGDPHLGMHAWHEETGEDFDLKIAERNLYAAVDKLVDLTDPSETAIILNCGDFFHADNVQSRTMRSGHILDVDTRWAKVLRVGFQLMVRVIVRALEKHQKVKVVNSIGNHDDHSAIFLSLALAAMFDKNPRVTIDQTPSKFHYHEFGQNLFGFHHGDTTPVHRLVTKMANEQREAWGRTKFHYWHCGHVHHHRKDLEYDGVIIETHRTLAPKDNYAASHGYSAGRHMQSILYNKDHGEELRHTIGISRL